MTCFSSIPKKRAECEALFIRAAGVVDTYRGDSSRTAFRLEFLKQWKQSGKAKIHGVVLPEQAIEAILAVHTIETELVEGYRRLVWRIVKRRFQNFTEGFVTYLDQDDAFSEGVMALVDCFYAFRGVCKGKPTKFITYAYRCINRRISRLLNSASTNHLRRPGYVVKLIEDFEKAANDDAHNFDEVCERLSVSPKKREILLRALIPITHLAKGITPETETLVAPDKPTLEPDDLDRLARIWGSLTEFEQAVLRASMQGGYGWQTAVAKEHINPNTGKCYSRRAPYVALDKIRNLLKVA